MTGTLVKIGQRVAAALAGRERWSWLPFLRLWLGLILGAVAGAISYGALGLRDLWIATLVAGAMSLITGHTAHTDSPGGD